MNTLIEINQGPITMKNQASDKMISSAFDPIPFFCAPSSSSSSTTPAKNNKNVANRNAELAINTNMVTMIRIPCRARGVCDTHTPSNAFFEIPEDCQHGKFLACSHKLCRDSGRRFRYCKTCDQVTAKRNFTKRHAHGITKMMHLSPIDVTRVDSTTSRTSCKRRKVSIDSDNEPSLACLFESTTGISGEGDEFSDSSELLPRALYTSGISNKTSSGNTLMMISRHEANLLELVNDRSCTSDGVALNHRIQRVLDATRSDFQDNILKEEILTDDEDDTALSMQPPTRMQSIDRFFDIFTESFEQMIMK